MEQNKNQEQNNMVSAFCSVNDLANYIHLSSSTIYKLVKNNQIEYVRIGKRILFEIEYVKRWIEEHKGYVRNHI